MKWQTPTSFDKTVIAGMDEKIAQGERIATPPGSQYSAHKLAEDYSLLTNNCTTLCLTALDDAEEKSGFRLEGLEKIEDENDPRDLYDYLKRLSDEDLKEKQRANGPY